MSPSPQPATPTAAQPQTTPPPCTAHHSLARVSHELRTPLASVRGYAELLLNGDLGPLTADQTDALRVITRNVERLSLAITAAIDLTAPRGEVA